MKFAQDDDSAPVFYSGTIPTCSVSAELFSFPILKILVSRVTPLSYVFTFFSKK